MTHTVLINGQWVVVDELRVSDVNTDRVVGYIPEAVAAAIERNKWQPAPLAIYIGCIYGTVVIDALMAITSVYRQSDKAMFVSIQLPTSVSIDDLLVILWGKG